jgi:hypothetical protein
MKIALLLFCLILNFVLLISPANIEYNPFLKGFGSFQGFVWMFIFIVNMYCVGSALSKELDKDKRPSTYNEPPGGMGYGG